MMENFQKKLVAAVKSRVGGEYIVRHDLICKNNDVEANVINIFKEAVGGVNINIDKVFLKYKQGEKTIDTIADEIVEVFNREKVMSFNAREQVLETLFTYEKCKDKLFVKLLNAESNRLFLENKIYQPFNDLAMVLYFEVEREKDYLCSIAISQDIYDTWELQESKEELIKCALQNSERIYPALVKPMYDMLTQLAGVEKDSDTGLPDIDVEMTVITNNMCIYGAGVILYKNLLKELSEKNNKSDLIILPSSVNEVIVCTKDAIGKRGSKKLQEMVYEINCTRVNPEEVLSNNVYLYCYEKDEIVIWKE